MKPTLNQAQTCLDRYKAWMSRQLTRTHWCGNKDMDIQYDEREVWLSARRRYLERAVREAERIIP